MAAAEGEGSQSENNNDEPHEKTKGKPFSTMHQEIENKLVKPGTSYEDRVGIVLSGWDHLAGAAPTGQLTFVKFLYKWTLQLVLQGEWPKLEKIVKTRLKATLQRCTRDEMMHPMCNTLLPLVTDPWGHPTLKAIIAGSYVSDEETEQYIREETWPVVRVRINTLVDSRCEELALSLLKVCIRCIRIKSDLKETLLNSQEDHNHFVDLYYVLMYKYQRKQFVEEVKRMDLLEGVDHIRRLLAQQEKSKVWKSRLKVVELEIQIILASCIVKPFENVFSSVFSEWCNVMREVSVSGDEFAEMVRKYIQLSESSQHVYSMGSVLYKEFGETHAALVTELLIRALTFDMNALEGVKLHSKEGNVEEQTRLEHQMAEGFMNLSTVFGQHESISRECVLTAFSLHPTSSRLEKLKSFGLLTNNGEGVSSESMIKEEPSNSANNIESPSIPEETSSHPPSEPVMNKDNEDLHDKNFCTYKEENINQKESVEILDTGQCFDDISQIENSNVSSSNSSPSSSANVNPTLESFKIERASETHNNTVDLKSNKFEVDSKKTSLEQKDSLEIKTEINSCNNYRKGKRDIWELVDESECSLNSQGESSKVKDDVDSMDGFLATTEGLIEQLNKEIKVVTQEEKPPVEEMEPPHFDILTDPQAVLNEEKLGLSKELCDDLAVVLSSPRWQVLSWMLERSKLLTICDKYMKDVDSAKNVTKELKFLNLDYSQFQHLPSAEVDEFTGIEKGYEHFIENTSEVDEEEDYYFTGIQNYYSSGSEMESGKRNRSCILNRRGKRGRPPLKSRYLNSDSDSTGRSKSRSRAVTSLSESEDSEFDLIPRAVDKNDKEFEGKRVTAISSYDRRKRLRIDATTGRVKRSYGKSSNVNQLRLYRHESPFLTSRSSLTSSSTSSSTGYSYNGCISRPAPINVNSNVVLNHYDRSTMDNRIRDPLDNGIPSESLGVVSHTGKIEAKSNSITPVETESKSTPFQKSPYNGNWRYAGYVISKPQKDNSMTSSITMSPKADTVNCSYRTKEGRLVTLNTHNYGEDESPHNVEYLRKLGNPSSKFEESFAKFLMQQKSNLNKNSPNVAMNKKNFPLEKSFEYLKRQGTSVIFKKSNNSTNALATAQKNVLDQIMSPENSRHGIIGRSSNEQLPIRAIAMPVSHNPPNLPPTDKNNPTGLSRVLPKGTTVVRRPKTDTGAGPSGLNNGGPTAVISRSQIVRNIPNQPRPAISITPSSNFLGSGTVTSFSNNIPIRNNLNQTSLASNFNPLEGPSTSFQGSLSSQAEAENFSPLASATVVGSVSQTLSPRLNSNNSPGETQGSSFVSLNSNRNATFNNLNQATSCTTTTTVAAISGEIRAPSMLESLLRDRSTPSSPLVLPIQNSESSALTATSSSITDLNVASSSPITGSSVPTSSLSEALNLVTTPNVNTSNSEPSVSLPGSVSVSVSNASDNTVAASISSNINLGVPSIPVVGSSLPTSVLPSSLPASVISSGVATHVNVSTGGAATAVEPQATGMHQLLLPAQFIQVQGSDGSTGLGIVHSGSLDLRLPPGTRVIKSSTNNMRPTAPVAISQTPSRPLNVLHNVKIVQNRQIVRTVVVPHSMALQSLGGQQTAQLVALNQPPGGNNNGLESQLSSKISSTQLQKVLGHNIVPGGLVIRAVRPQTTEASVEDNNIIKPPAASIIQHTSEVQSTEKEKVEEKSSNKVVPVQATEEGLAERLSRHYLKTALLASTSTQSVGTQTQTTAVKPVTGQLVNQVVMNHLRGISGNGNQSATSVPVVTNSVPSSGLSPLSLSSSNAVSSETLEQLREFESVFEKVSNKSVKDNDTTKTTNQPNFPPANISSEESMIAAQLLSMADTPSVTSAPSYVYTIPTTSESAVVTLSSSTATASISSSTVTGTRLGEGTFITIPSSTQGGGTLILVNPSAATSGTMTSTAQTSQPPPAASPALSSTSSHSSVASSPSSTSSKSKSKGSKPKVTTPPSGPVTPTKPKSPPPPKAPPKPTVAKPQVEESDETRARIQAILDQYKQDLANTPQPQPAPRNRKNCPPPKNEGKSSSKKKSQVKKPDGTSSTSPCASESGNLPSVSPSPAPLAATPSGEDSEGSIGGASITSSNFQSQDEKKSEDGVSSQILQGVVVSNVKVDNSLGNSIPTIPQGRVVQLIRHGSKVTAITTKQPYQKSKAGLSSGGPPPNVTIQGRINMNDLMESHLASLLTGGSATISQNSALITKLIQAQQQQNPVQQVVVQTSGGGMGQQVIQQVSLQPVIATHNKTQQIQNQIISGGVNLGDSNNQPSNSPVKSSLRPQPSPVMSIGVSPSPGTPQQRVSSPSTPSPAPELPSTPSSFPTAEEESNSSEESNDGISAAPLPPFFTLTKQFMTPQQNQQFSDKINDSSSQISLTSTNDSAKTKSKLASERSATNSPTVTVVTSQPSRSMFIRSSFNKTVNINCPTTQGSKSNISGSIMLAHSAPPSPLVSAPGENVLEMSPVSGPSSLESSPSMLSHRLPLVTTSELRSNSLDSVKSDLSVEEVQIPPSPATLTKQLQNAYMTEAALSPTVSHSHLSSSSSYSSPNTVQDLQSTEPRVIFPNLGHTSHTYSLAGQSSSASSLSNTSNGSATHNNPSMENNTLTCLSSPSGDVYLDQAGVGLGLDSLPLVEGRPQSPSLSDLVPAVPLLSWSPRSADSIMGQSPSLNEALTGNMTLDVHHSEDSLCDSSTGFPGLFAMDGDGASASSTNSDDILNPSNPCLPISSASTNSAVFSIAPSQVLSHTDHIVTAPHNSFGKRLPNHEQDHTISSTRTDSLRTHLGSLELPQPGPGSDDTDLLKQDESTSSTIQGDPWKFETISKDNSNAEIGLSDENVDSPNDRENDTGRDTTLEESFLNKKCHLQNKSNTDIQNAKTKKESGSGFLRNKMNQFASNDVDKKRNSEVKEENQIVHNGFEALDNMKELSDDDKKLDNLDENSSVSKKEINSDEGVHQSSHKRNCTVPKLVSDSDENFMGCEKLSKTLELKTEFKDEEDISRQTRGSKRRNDSDFLQEEKRSRSSRSRKPENVSDLSPEEEKPPPLLLGDEGISGAPLTRSLRGRNISGTSDSSSNYSVDRVSTPGPLDSPAESGNGNSRRRKRRSSHDSSVSSRDSSPLTVLLNSQQEGNGSSTGTMHTRRSSSRDHAKKTRCRCCVDQSSSSGTSGRRASGRVSRGSGPHSSSTS